MNLGQEDTLEEVLGSGLAACLLPESLFLEVTVSAATFPHLVRAGVCGLTHVPYLLGWVERKAPV